MRSVRSIAIALGFICVCASGAAAQDSGTVGVTMGYPASFGLIWRVTDTLAIRPELSLAGTSSTSESITATTSSLESDGHAIATGASALFYVARFDQLRTYVSPRFSYARTTNSGTITNSFGLPPSNTKTTATAWGGSGSFGAEYALSKKFSAFGEIGLGVTRTTVKSNTSVAQQHSTAWSTRSGVGVIFYF
jgi:hypothetical protein